MRTPSARKFLDVVSLHSSRELYQRISYSWSLAVSRLEATVVYNAVSLVSLTSLLESGFGTLSPI